MRGPKPLPLITVLPSGYPKASGEKMSLSGMTFQGLRDDLLAAEAKGQLLFFLGKVKYFTTHLFI